VTWRFLTRLGWLPSDAAAVHELDHMILPDVPLGGLHGENLTHGVDALPRVSLSQIVVAVPAGLLNRIRNELEDSLRTGRDLPAGPDHPRNLTVTCHALIEAPTGALPRIRSRGISRKLRDGRRGSSVAHA